MAKIKNIELKNIRATYGLEGMGFIANVYYKNKKIGTTIDRGDGGAIDIDIDKDYINIFNNIVEIYYKEYPAYSMNDNEGFIIELLDLKRHEKIYKHSLKEGYKKLMVLAHAKRDEDSLHDTNCIFDNRLIKCNFEGDKVPKEILNHIKNNMKNTQEIINIYTSLEDFIIK